MYAYVLYVIPICSFSRGQPLLCKDVSHFLSIQLYIFLSELFPSLEVLFFYFCFFFSFYINNLALLYFPLFPHFFLVTTNQNLKLLRKGINFFFLLIFYHIYFTWFCHRCHIKIYKKSLTIP